jgi:hypothetical protein
MAQVLIHSSSEKDTTWFTIAKDFGQLTYEWNNIFYKTLNSYGFSHTMSSCTRYIYNILSVNIASILDTMVCSNYPMTVNEITVDNISVSLTDLFYNFPNPDISTINLIAYKYKKRSCTYSDDDRDYIKMSIAHLRCFLIKMTEIDIITQNENYNIIKQKCTKMKRYLDRYEVLFGNV